MTKKEIRKLAKECIYRCKDRCYETNGRNASNELEGDFGTWKDWEDVLVEFAYRVHKR